MFTGIVIRTNAGRLAKENQFSTAVSLQYIWEVFDEY